MTPATACHQADETQDTKIGQEHTYSFSCLATVGQDQFKLGCSLTQCGLQNKQPKVKVYENIPHILYDLMLLM